MNLKLEKTKNATRNIYYGMISKVYQMIIPFIMRTIMIYYLGIEYLGLNSLFGSILQVLNLAELGVGSAMVYSMYKPIAEDDNRTLCALLNLYKTYYRVIGGVILTLGLLILPFLDVFISGSTPREINIYVIYLITLSETVLSYWLYAYKQSLLNAYQRIDVISKNAIVIHTLKYVFQIFSLVILKNYYAYILCTMTSQILINISVGRIVSKIFPEIKAKGKIESEEIKKINCRIKDVFTYKLGNVVLNVADTIIISSFLGLTVLAVYQNYYYIIAAFISLLSILLNSSIAGIGNSLKLDNSEKVYSDFETITFLFTWLTGVCTCCLLCSYQTFMFLWVGEAYLLDNKFVILMSLYFYSIAIIKVIELYKDAAGAWSQDKYRPLFTSAVNLLINLSLVNKIGLYGIIISTILSQVFIGIPWIVKNVFDNVFKKKANEFIVKFLKYFLISVFAMILGNFISVQFNEVSVVILVLKGLISFFVFNIIFWMFFRKTLEYRKLKLLILKNLVKKND